MVIGSILFGRPFVAFGGTESNLVFPPSLGEWSIASINIKSAIRYALKRAAKRRKKTGCAQTRELHLLIGHTNQAVREQF
jgi:hypothetical protein